MITDWLCDRPRTGQIMVLRSSTSAHSLERSLRRIAERAPSSLHDIGKILRMIGIGRDRVGEQILRRLPREPAVYRAVDEAVKDVTLHLKDVVLGTQDVFASSSRCVVNFCRSAGKFPRGS